MKLFGKIGLVVAAALASGAAQASILVDQSSTFGGYYIGGFSWVNFSAMIGAEPVGYTVGSVADSAAVSSASAVLITLRGFNDTLSAAEIANISAALAAGKHVAIFGENSAWPGWDASIIGFASDGAASPIVNTDYSGTVTPVVANELTAGVSPFFIAAGALHTPGGIDLFDTSFATLWKNQNLLTILDVNSFDDGLGNTRFMQNVADWLGEGNVVPDVPEPASWMMMIGGFGAIGATMRRRRTTVRFA